MSSHTCEFTEISKLSNSFSQHFLNCGQGLATVGKVLGFIPHFSSRDGFKLSNSPKDFGNSFLRRF